MPNAEAGDKSSNQTQRVKSKDDFKTTFKWPKRENILKVDKQHIRDQLLLVFIWDHAFLRNGEHKEVIKTN